MSSQVEPPLFQEAARCDVCKCSFNTFRRRHHCRCCGRTFCFEHSSNQMALPQFGIHTPARVCADCYNNSSKLITNASQTSVGVDEVSDSVSTLNLADSKRVPVDEHPPAPCVPECKCRMPLCICEAPVAPANLPPQQSIPVTVPSNPRPKKAESVPKAKGSSTSNIKNSSVFNTSHEINGASDKPKMDYIVNGEGLREAIKNDDAAAVRKLLREGVDANYCDKQGMSLLHLAAVFNRTDIAFILMDSGANLDSKNAQGETPLDCAAATLQYKMRKRMEGGS